MESRKSSVFHVAKNEYLRWIMNPRMILLVCMLLFIMSYVGDSMIAASVKMEKPLQLFEIFIAVGNSVELCIVIPAVFFLLIGDFPRRDGNTMLYIYRTGKYQWLLGQLLAAVMDIVTYLGIVVLACIAMGHGHLTVSDRWSETVTRYAITYPDDRKATITSMITGRLYNNFTPLQAFLYSVTLLFGLLFLLTVIKLICFLLGKATVGVGIVAGLMVFGWTFSLLDSKAKWLLPLSHAIEWQHCDMILRFLNVPMAYSYFYFAVLSIVGIMVCVFLVDRFDFGCTERQM